MRRSAAAALLGCCAVLAACSSGTHGKASVAPTAAATSSSTVTSSPTSVPPSAASSSTAPKPRPSSSKPAPSRTSPAAGRLPLDFTTGSATRVVTAVASSTSRTQGVLQAWQRSGSGWVRVGPSVHAWFGSSGLTSHPSETNSATPIGSFTLTEAFGHDSNPGTALPYRQTTPADWWISQPGSLYNTEQHCSSGCSFTQGSPNEHLYYETPYYDYAVVIDYNRFPVHQGAGSAFFLHVTVGLPTAGCVSIDKTDLVRILQWLTPSAHPRILIGVA